MDQSSENATLADTCVSDYNYFEKSVLVEVLSAGACELSILQDNFGREILQLLCQ